MLKGPGGTRPDQPASIGCHRINVFICYASEGRLSRGSMIGVTQGLGEEAFAELLIIGGKRRRFPCFVTFCNIFDEHLVVVRGRDRGGESGRRGELGRGRRVFEPARRSRLRDSETNRGGLRKIASLDLRMGRLTEQQTPHAAQQELRSHESKRLSRSFALPGIQRDHLAARTRGISVISSSTRESRLVTISAEPSVEYFTVTR